MLKLTLIHYLKKPNTNHTNQLIMAETIEIQRILIISKSTFE